MIFRRLNNSRDEQPSSGILSDFEKGKIAQALEDTTRFDEMIVGMKRQLADTNERYEVLRQMIDGGSESMTHDDAVRDLQYLLDRDWDFWSLRVDSIFRNAAWYKRMLDFRRAIDDSIVVVAARDATIRQLQSKLDDANERAENVSGLEYQIRDLCAACNDQDTVIAARGDHILGLRGILQRAASAVESLAFKMPPPNHYTPQFVELAISMRSQMQSAENVRTQDPREHYDTDLGRLHRGGG